MSHEYTSTGTFDESLAQRTQVSIQQRELLRGKSGNTLEAEAWSVTVMLKRFAEAAAQGAVNPSCAETFLQQLDLRFVTRDHNWRQIFRKLAAEHKGSGRDKVAAISQYLCYLGSRQQLIKDIWRNRRALEDTHDEATRYRPVTGGAPGGTRLPKNQPVWVLLPYRGKLDIYLGEHKFHILDGCPPKLLEPGGRSLRLPHGRSLLGRHPGCDCTISAGYSDVSRGHLSLEWHGDSRLCITDLSSRGTFLASECMTPPPGTGAPGEAVPGGDA